MRGQVTHIRGGTVLKQESASARRHRRAVLRIGVNGTQENTMRQIRQIRLQVSTSLLCVTACAGALTTELTGLPDDVLWICTGAWLATAVLAFLWGGGGVRQTGIDLQFRSFLVLLLAMAAAGMVAGLTTRDRSTALGAAYGLCVGGALSGWFVQGRMKHRWGLHFLQAAREGAAHERHRLARDLHDGLLQTLAVANIRLGAVLSGRPDMTPDEICREVMAMLSEEIESVRALGGRYGLHPPPEPDLGSAVKALAARSADAHGLRIRVRLHLPGRHGWDVTHLTAYRIVKEALNNVVKHSGAENVNVTVAAHHNRLVAKVRDDGHGFDPSSEPSGLGLLGMHARAVELGGTLKISSGAGTTVKMVLPWSAPIPAAEALEDVGSRR
jgi:signal transduction histidine kinase